MPAWCSSCGAVAALDKSNSPMQIRRSLSKSRPFIFPVWIQNRREPHRIIRLFTISGNARWIEDGKPVLEIAAGQSLVALNEQDAQVTDHAELPIWVRKKFALPIHANATEYLASKVVENRPVTLSLQEQANSRRVEVRSLVACCLGLSWRIRSDHDGIKR